MSATTNPRSRMPRPLCALVAVAIAVAAVLTSPLSQTASATPADEASFFSLLNDARTASGLARLANDPAAAAVAGQWSSQMAARDSLSHNPDLASQVTRQVTPDWTRIGENVGVGYSVRSLHDAFMASPAHRANILGDFNRVGIGVVNDASGRLWVTFVFIKGPAITSAAFDVPRANPEGSLDSTTTGLGRLSVSGWALDPNTSAPIEVHVYVGGVGTVLTAAMWRGDIAAAFPQHGGNHGFAGSVNTPPVAGTYDLCAYGINVGEGSNSLLGCRKVSIDRDPTGSLDGLTTTTGSIRVSGWAVDPDRVGPVDVHVYVGGVGSVLHADDYRADLAGVLPAEYGGSHGFSGTVALPTTSGVYDLCAYGINQGAGSNRLLGCRQVAVQRDPLGSVDHVARVDGGIRVSGWSLDPDTSAPIDVHVYSGGGAVPFDAAITRGDVAIAFPGFGAGHGYDLVVPAGPSPTTVCVYGINAGAGGNRLLGCATA